MISIDHSRYSHAGIDFHKEFVVHYPRTEQAAAVWFCGIKSGRGTDKIKEACFSLIDSVAVHVPTIEGATVAFECKVVGQFETGDHTVFVGEVVATRGELQKAGHLSVTSNYAFFSLEGASPYQYNVISGGEFTENDKLARFRPTTCSCLSLDGSALQDSSSPAA